MMTMEAVQSSSRHHRRSDITSTTDLQNILSNCKECQKITLEGKLILPHSELPNIKLKKLGRRIKYCLTVCSKRQGIGHWFTIITDNQTKKAFLLNGLRTVHFNEVLKANINLFCKINNLKLVDLSFPYQKKESLNCGRLAMFMVYKAHSTSTKKFLAFRKMMLNNNDTTNEIHMIKEMKKHFKLK